METYADYQRAKCNLLAGLVGRFNALTSGIYDDPLLELARYREIAANAVAEYEELSWPAARVGGAK